MVRQNNLTVGPADRLLNAALTLLPHDTRKKERALHFPVSPSYPRLVQNNLDSHNVKELNMSKSTVAHVKGSKASNATLPEKVLCSNIIGGIVELFTNNITYIDRNGEVVEYNTHKYSLHNALNGLAFSMSRQKEYVEGQVDKAREVCKKALMAFNPSSEISVQEMTQAEERLNQREDELQCIELLLNQSVKAYEAFTEKKFEYKGKPTNAPVQNVHTEDPRVQAMARRLGVNLDHVTSNTDEVGNQIGLAGRA